MITGIRLQRFRSYIDESFEIDPGVNIIVGPNASGKTNLLESILVNSIGSSYRAQDAELIGFDKEWARIDTDTPEGTRTTKLIQEPSGLTRKEFIIQDQSFKRLSLVKTVPVVLFEPNHLQLLTGSPDMRRDYLDNLLEQLVTGYSTLRRQYKRTLAQRNRLLKQGKQHAGSQLFAWNIRLSQLGGEIALHRIQLIQSLNKDIQTIYRELSNSKVKVTIHYTSTCNPAQYSSDMLHKLEETVETDFERGFTSKGPHRDNIQIQLNGHILQDTASRGETRTMLLALKICELKLIEVERGRKPILLLDDVFSELDGARRKALTEVLRGYQTFITTTDADVVIEHFLGNCTVIPLGTTR